MTLNLYAYTANNPLKYIDPSGHQHIVEGVSGPGYLGESYTPAWAQYASDAIIGTMQFAGTLAYYLFVDDIYTIIDPNSSSFDKSLSAASFIPIARIVKGGKLIVKLANGEKEIERAVELTQDAWNASSSLGCTTCIDAISISDKKMFQLGDHFEKHGRGMGYSSKKEYDAAAKEFANLYQGNSSATIVQGTWNGSGSLNGSLQRAIMYDGKTVVLDVNTGQVIDFFVGTEYKGISVVNLQ